MADDEGFRAFDRVRELTERGELGSGVGVNKFGPPPDSTEGFGI